MRKKESELKRELINFIVDEMDNNYNKGDYDILLFLLDYFNENGFFNFMREREFESNEKFLATAHDCLILYLNLRNEDIERLRECVKKIKEGF